jgi:hypothetical protein
VLIINKKRNPKEGLNMKVKGKRPEGDPNEGGNYRLGKMLHRGKEEHGKELRRRRRRSREKTETDGEAWLSDDPHKVETS